MDDLFQSLPIKGRFPAAQPRSLDGEDLDQRNAFGALFDAVALSSDASNPGGETAASGLTLPRIPADEPLVAILNDDGFEAPLQTHDLSLTAEPTDGSADSRNTPDTPPNTGLFRSIEAMLSPDVVAQPGDPHGTGSFVSTRPNDASSPQLMAKPTDPPINPSGALEPRSTTRELIAPRDEILGLPQRALPEKGTGIGRPIGIATPANVSASTSQPIPLEVNPQNRAPSSGLIETDLTSESRSMPPPAQNPQAAPSITTPSAHEVSGANGQLREQLTPNETTMKADAPAIVRVEPQRVTPAINAQVKPPANQLPSGATGRPVSEATPVPDPMIDAGPTAEPTGITTPDDIELAPRVTAAVRPLAEPTSAPTQRETQYVTASWSMPVHVAAAPATPLDVVIGLDGAIPFQQTQSAPAIIASPMAAQAFIPTANTPHLVAQQIAASLQDRANEPGQPIELALDPPELGRVRMHVAELAGVLTLTIHAERSETAELMRRHMDLLSQEFAEAGVDAPAVRISQDGAGDTGAQDKSSDDRAAAGTASIEDAQQDQPTPTRNSSGALDLRL